MKDNFVRFLRKYAIALCAGITCVLIAVAFYLHNPLAAKAEEAEKTNVLTLLEGKEHPYVFVNEEYLDKLMTLKDNPYYSSAYARVVSQAEKALPAQPEGGVLAEEISRQLEAKAFMYMLGELSEKEAVATVEYTIEYLKNAQSNISGAIDRYKDFGTNAIQTGSLVYDWCYDLMTQKQRDELAASIRERIFGEEQQNTSENVEDWTSVGFSSVGVPLIYNSIAAVALYDVYPDIYNDTMPKILGSMAEAVKIYGTAGALSDGSIAYSRAYCAYHVAVLLDRLGYEHEVFYGNQAKVGYRMLYSRIPYGALIRYGDDFDQRYYAIGNYINRFETTETMSILSALYDDPYLKFQYVKENANDNSLFALLLKSSEVEPELPDDLPLAFEVEEPMSEIFARTSWQDGLDAPTVTAYMNMNNRRTGDHDHAHFGSFQLYYKGPLTMSSGRYTGSAWGGEHWRNYATRSISANCVTVYDEDEVYKYGPIGEIAVESNDGGQKMSAYKPTIEKHFADDNLLTITESSFIGPNENTPAFSYIKGDLTNAYSSNKMASYKRAMVFMDTFNEEFPGVMIVFDRVVSTNKDFPKKWLLQAVTQPVVDGNKITITNTDEGCNGKLVNTTLYPQSVSIKTVGDIGKFIADGQEWSIGDQGAASNAYFSGIRCEVSPTVAATEDIFLNAMYVTDAMDAEGNLTTAEISMIAEETDTFMGVTTLDRMVMFSKSGEKVNTAFDITVRDNEYENVICLITDVTSGKWNISGNSISIVAEATEKDGCLVFTVKPGTYTITPASTDAAVTDVIWEEAEKEKIGDFTIKIGSTYAYVKNENRLVDGQPYIAIADFMERYYKATTETNGRTLKITLSDGRVATFTAGSKEYTIGSESSSVAGTLAYEPFLDANGVFYMNCTGVSSHLGLNDVYTAKTKVMRCAVMAELEGVDSSKVLWPVAISASSDDGNAPDNTIDRNLNTRWASAVGDGEWICFDLGEEKEISSVQIAFYNGANRNWRFDIQISDDGVNFVDVLISQKSCGTTVNPETFTLPTGTKARYVRYVGHGVEDSNNPGTFISYNNTLTEFIINK